MRFYLVGRGAAVLVEDDHHGRAGDEVGVAQLRLQEALQPRVGICRPGVVAVVFLHAKRGADRCLEAVGCSDERRPSKVTSFDSQGRKALLGRNFLKRI